MTRFLEFAVLGLGLGAVYALLGQGLVMIYRGSGVVNFAQAGFAVAGAYVYYELHQLHHWTFVLAFVVAVGFASMLGAVTQVLIMRPLQHASALARLIATLGVLATIGGVVTLIYQDNQIEVQSSLPTTPLRWGSITIPEAQLYLLLIAAVLTLILWAVTRYTLLGIAMTGVAENQRAASSLGWSPDSIALFTWMTGAGLAAVAGILVVPLSGLYASGFILIVVAAMAATLVGGFTSFWITLLAGVAIGVLQSEAANYAPSLQGFNDALPFFVIILVLLVRGRALPLRGDILERLPMVGTGIVRLKVIIPLCVGLSILIVTVFPQALILAVTTQLVVSVILLGVVVVTGYAGQVSLATFALAGMGAYFAGRLVSAAHWPFVAALVVGVVGNTVVGIVFGLPALRTRGINLAIATLGLGLAVSGMLFNNPNYTGGEAGTPVGGAKLFNFSIDPIGHPDRYAIFCLVAFVLAAIAVANLRRGRAGRRLLAVRSNERAAASIGIGVTGAKLAAFALASSIAGLGGVLLGFQNHAIIFDSFDPLTSINAVTWTTIGGIGTVAGSVVGSGFASGGVGSYIIDRFGSIAGWLPIIGGVSVIVVLIQNPDGIVPKIASGEDPIARLVAAGVRRLPIRRVVRVRREPGPAAPPRGADRIDIPPKMLRIEDLTVRYGGVLAVSEFSMDVHPREIVGLVGPNGAGKTTVIDAISGFKAPTAGTVSLEGRSLQGMRPQERCALGMTRSFQSVEIFEEMTVRENLQAAGDSRDIGAFVTNLVRPGSRAMPVLATKAIDMFGLTPLLDRRPTDLSYAQRRIVGIARAVATRPSNSAPGRTRGRTGRGRGGKPGRTDPAVGRRLGNRHCSHRT